MLHLKKYNKMLSKRILLSLLVGLCIANFQYMYAAKFTVTMNNGNDYTACGGGPPATLPLTPAWCDGSVPDPSFPLTSGSLSWCIQACNATPALDTIIFAAGVTSINLNNPALFTISTPILFDGFSHPSYVAGNCTPMVEFYNNTLNVTAAGCTFRGIRLNQGGTAISFSGATVTSGTVVGCWFGLAATGIAAAGTVPDAPFVVSGGATAIVIGGNSTNCQVYNVILADGDGITFNGATSGNNSVLGNYFNIAALPLATLGNVALLSGSPNQCIKIVSGSSNNTIGSPTGINYMNLSAGQFIYIGQAGSNCNSTIIESNYMGLAKSGTVALGTGPTIGVHIDNTSTGTVIKNNNITLKSAGAQYVLAKTGCGSLTISGNYCNVDFPLGTTLLRAVGPNECIQLNTSGNSLIKDNILPGATNIGILIDGGSSFKMYGNKIGVDKNGAGANRAFGSKMGIQTKGDATKVYIGGTVAGQGNVIANSAEYGFQCTGPAAQASTDSIVVIGNMVGIQGSGIQTAFNYGNYKCGGYIEKWGNAVMNNNVFANNGPITGAAAFFDNMGCYIKTISKIELKGNMIGVDITGNTRAGNVGNGLRFDGVVSNVTMGGTTTAERNVIGDNGANRAAVWPDILHGVQFFGGPFTNITILGNNIGLGADGGTNVSNYNIGIDLRSATTFAFGNGTAAGANRFYNNTFGIFCQSTTGTIKGNIFYNNGKVGDAEGANLVMQGSSGIAIGGSVAGEGNSFNYGCNGIWLRDDGAGGCSNITIKGNSIRNQNKTTFSRTGYITPAATTSSGHGIQISDNSNNITIGGTAANEPNVIQVNDGFGIFNGWGKTGAGSTSIVTMRRNSIACNNNRVLLTGVTTAGAGIQNNNTAYNTGAGNTGYPAPSTTPLSSFSQLTFTGPNTIGGVTNAASDIVEIFFDNACGTCEGNTYLGTVTGTTTWTFTHASITSAVNITATATSSTGNTSRFSGCTPLALPVEMVVFKATVTSDNSVVLNWETATEQDNAYFVIQRSADGKLFESIGKVDGQGNSSSSKWYEFIDTATDQALYYYRIIQVDNDGKSSPTNVIKVNLHGNTSIAVYPNPSNGLFTIEMALNTSSPYEMAVYNAIGVEVFSNSGTALQGFDRSVLDLSNFAQGVYFLHVIVDGTKIIQKIVKK